MPKLSHKDSHLILNSISILHSEVSASSLADRTLNAVNKLIASELTAFDGFDSEAEYAGSYWYSPSGTVPIERVQMFGELVHEHPYFQDALETQSVRTFRTSDYLSLKKFHKTTLFNEFYRIFDGEVQMASAMRLGPASLITCSLHRSAKDFSNREVGLLGLLTPHLASAFRNSRAFDKIRSERDILSKRATNGLIVVGFDLTKRFVSDRAVDLLKIYFPEFKGNGLPVRVGDLVNTQIFLAASNEYKEVLDEITVRTEQGELNIRAIMDLNLREITLVLSETRELEMRDLLPFGLSPRETEVMLWLCRGKSDSSIAVLCGIALRTVQKHVENILTKLGVENRANVVSLAYQRTRPGSGR